MGGWAAGVGGVWTVPALRPSQREGDLRGGELGWRLRRGWRWMRTGNHEGCPYVWWVETADNERVGGGWGRARRDAPLQGMGEEG